MKVQSATGVSTVCDACPKLTLSELTLGMSGLLLHLYYKISCVLGELFIKYVTSQFYFFSLGIHQV